VTVAEDVTSFDERLSQDDRWNAGRMHLRSGPHSAVARKLIRDLLEGVVVPAWPEGKQVRPSSLRGAERALGALVADLLKLHVEGRAGAHSAMRESFNSLPFGLNLFTRVRDALQAAGLLNVHLGSQRLVKFQNRVTGGLAKPISHGGQVSRYRLTQAALEQIRAAGVDLTDWASHWGQEDPSASLKFLTPSAAPAIVLRGKAERVNGVKAPGRELPVDWSDPQVFAILNDLEAHNAFLMAAGIGGFVFRGVRRVFNDGDQPGFAWQWGGGFYSQPGGEPYESMDGETRRAIITIGGEGVGEVDLTAAQLSLVYGLRGAALDPAASDPYLIDGFSRELVKAWTTKALGSASVAYRQWSKGARDYYAQVAPGRTLSRDIPISRVRNAVVERHPVLHHLGEPGITAVDLQFHQSEVIRKALVSLRSHGVAGLSVHDSLLVPSSALRMAEGALKEAFAAHVEELTGKPCSVIPSVKLKTADAM
jgi:hypothetical protein